VTPDRLEVAAFLWLTPKADEAYLFLVDRSVVYGFTS
jgi:hypothetical protein